MEYKFVTLDDALVGMCNELLSNARGRGTRGFQCFEMPEPVLITIEDPTSRIIKNPARGWSKSLPVAESIWLLNGVNSMDLPGSITKNLYSFSDDGNFMRAGYGPRIRSFSGVSNDYKINFPKNINSRGNNIIGYADQLKYVIESFKRDPNTRQASITIHDPAKDCFNLDGTLKTTKDTPCTRTIKFEKKNGRLDCTVTMRSNDVLWGFSAVNVFNFTLMQEIVSMLTKIPIGRYHHFVDNFHYYETVKDKITKIAESDYINKYQEPYYYSGLNGLDFNLFDEKLVNTYNSSMQILGGSQNPYASLELQKTGIDIFDDMILQIFKFKNKGLEGNKFYNNKFN